MGDLYVGSNFPLLSCTILQFFLNVHSFLDDIFEEEFLNRKVILKFGFGILLGKRQKEVNE